LVKGSPNYGVGTSKRGKVEYSTRYVPGPGTYRSQQFMGDDGKMHSMGQNIVYEAHKKEQLQKPGPGTYSPIVTNSKKKGSAYKIGTEERREYVLDRLRRETTAPTSYSPKFDLTKRTGQ